MKAILLSLFVALLMVGCGEQVVDNAKLQDRDGLKYLPNEETPFTGRAEGFYPNGQKAMETNYKDGKEDGIKNRWYNSSFKEDKTGQKHVQINNKDNKVVSAVAWKPNGEKCPETNVKDGNGVLVYYNNDGTVWVRSTFKDGELVFD